MNQTVVAMVACPALATQYVVVIACKRTVKHEVFACI